VDPRVLREPSLNRTAGGDEHVVKPKGDNRSARTGRPDRFQEGAEAGAVRTLGHGPDPWAAADVDSTEQRAALVLARVEKQQPLPLGDPGEAPPRKQIDVAPILGEDNRTRRDHAGASLAHAGPNRRLAFGQALWTGA